MNPTAVKTTGWMMGQAKGTARQSIPDYQRTHAGERREPGCEGLSSREIVGLANHTLLVRRDGTEIPIDDSGAPIREEMVKSQGLSWSSEISPNVSRTKRHCAKAMRAGFRLAAIIDSADDAIISKDLNGIITSWNKELPNCLAIRPMRCLVSQFCASSRKNYSTKKGKSSEK
jgi:PAS domain-containing protein